MNHSSRLLCILVFLTSGLSWFSGKSQNKIQLINGKVIEASSYSLGDMFLSYKKTGDKRSNMKAIDRYDIFSIIKPDGTEEMVYVADSLDFTIEEARSYIKGEQAANIYYKRPMNSISSAVIGAGSSILSFYALPVPMVYAIVLGRFNPQKMQVPTGVDGTIQQQDPYKIGYNKAARNIKIQQSLKWGYISLGVGLTALIIYGANN